MTENGNAGGVEVNNNNGCDKEEEGLSVPRGGLIYVPNLVGPLTSVPLFQSSILQEIQDLEAEVSSHSSQVSDKDIWVDELKIFTDDELVDMAIKVAFEDDEQEGRARDSETSNLTPCEKKSKKRKRGKYYNQALDETYIAKVGRIKRIKEKQDEDKAAV